jgi:hypothetical protein
MVNACSYYYNFGCGNVDDTSTRRVCQNVGTIMKFQDGHVYCRYAQEAGINNCSFRVACNNGYESDCWEKSGDI